MNAASTRAADPRVDFLCETGWFDATWYLSRCRDAAAEADPLAHYLETGVRSGIGPNAVIDGLRDATAIPWEQHIAAGDFLTVGPLDYIGGRNVLERAAQLQSEANLLDACGLFDAVFYLDNNPDVARSRSDPLSHFCKHGWRELRKPRRDFDTWWYWSTYLDPAREAINPLVHYALVGEAAGYCGVPGSFAPASGMTWPPGHRSRRICLFAGYDPDGLVDDYVIDYVRELSRHADVYYLADGFMPKAELDKLAPYTKGRWAERHGAYDFGSWSVLARDRVGWDAIAQYDELLLVNDSGYLLRNLDHVFARMDAKACDWWGLQLTKRNFHGEGPAKRAIPIDQVRAMMPEAEPSYLNSLHVSSYFVAFRKLVLADPRFRERLNAVTTQRAKSGVILKYEIGLSRWLIARGYVFDAFVPALYPYHPVYTATHFNLIRDGFPLLKRHFLAVNPLDAPNLVHWKERIRELVPDAPVEMFERNLLRVADDDKLQRSFAISENEYGEVVVPRLLEGEAFVQADRMAPKFDHWWAFPVCAYDHTFAGNERAVFEEVREDPSVKKIVLTRGKRVEVAGENVVVTPLRSPEGQYYLLRARQIFVKHGPYINTGYPLSSKLHNFINLWHGIPLKRFGYASLDMADRLGQVARENRGCRAVVCSSAIDRLAMTAAFHPLSYRDIWPTGLPRNDFVVRSLDRMPADFRAQEARLREEVDGRRLVLFLPTFRNAQAQASYRFSQEELSWLADWQARHGVVLGVREHMADRARSYLGQLSPLGTLDLSTRRYPNIEVLYRVGSALVTDYSSCAIDFLLTGQPVVSFAYDLERYAGQERGLFYDLEQVLPGPVCRNFSQLTTALDRLFETRDAAHRRQYGLKRRLFFDHMDDDNSWRLVKRVKQLYPGMEHATTNVSSAGARLCVQ